MTEKADRTEEAFRLLQEAHLHHSGPKSAVRAAARLVLAGMVKTPHEKLAKKLEWNAAGLRMAGEQLIDNALNRLRNVTLPCASNNNGHAIVSLARCVND